jgi:hypothetical protein
MIKVLISDGIRDTLSDVYSRLKRSGVRYGIPFTRIYATRKSNTAKVTIAAPIVRSASTPEPG